MLKLVNSKHDDWASIKLLTFSVLTFLFTLPRCQVIFKMKTNKRKVRKCLNYVKKFPRRFDLTNGKYLSVFLGVFAGLSKFNILLRLSTFEQSNVKKSSREKSKTKDITWIFLKNLVMRLLEFVTQFCVTREFTPDIYIYIYIYKMRI